MTKDALTQDSSILTSIELGLPMAQSYLFFGSAGSGVQEAAQLLAERESLGSQYWSLDGKSAKVEDVRGLADFVSLKPATGKKQVALILNAHELNMHSHNALLKTLEEPRESALIILVASVWNIPSTIVSRCRVVRFASAGGASLGEERDFADYRALFKQNAVSRLSYWLSLTETEGALEERICRLLEQVRNLGSSDDILRYAPYLLEANMRLNSNANKKMLAGFLARKLVGQ